MKPAGAPVASAASLAPGRLLPLLGEGKTCWVFCCSDLSEWAPKSPSDGEGLHHVLQISLLRDDRACLLVILFRTYFTH